MSRVASFEALRAKVAAMELGRSPDRPALSFGDTRLDQVFPSGGLPLGCWHEVLGDGPEVEMAAATGAFAAALAAPLALRGAVVWVMRRDDLHAPGLAGLGFPADRLIQVKTRDEAQALAALEDALGAGGVAAAIGEVAGADLTAGRRLQLACEKRGTTGFLIRRRPFGGPALRAPAAGERLRDEAGGSAASTRWVVAPAPSGPCPTGGELGGKELGAPRWRVALTRSRGGRLGRWIMEQNNGPYPLRVVAELGDRQLEASDTGAWRRAG